MFSELEHQKLQFINNIKQQTKEEILPKKPEKKSLWKRVQDNFREIDRGHNQFKIDISGTEFIFLQETLLTDEIDTVSDNQD